MNVATDAPKRPALRYYGGKWNLAPWIISHFPPHKNYVEPCGGAASVLLQKYGTYLQTHNGRDALWDAYQEAMDLCMYLRQAILERDGNG